MDQVRFAVIPLLILLSLPASGQKPPDISGVWKMDASQSDSAHQGVPIGPVTLVVKQSLNELSIETRRATIGKSMITSETLTFKLDGSETSIMGNAGVPIKVKAHWDGMKLIAETARNVESSAVTTMQIFSVNASGKELTIHKSLTIQHGYQFPGAANTGTGRDVFRKSSNIKK